MWHIYALASILGLKLQSIYPEFNKPIHPVYNRIVEPRIYKETSCSRHLAVMWTRMGGALPKGEDKWAPNYFVPCLPSSYLSPMQTILSSCSLSGVSKPKAPVRNPHHLQLPPCVGHHFQPPKLHTTPCQKLLIGMPNCSQKSVKSAHTPKTFLSRASNPRSATRKKQSTLLWPHSELIVHEVSYVSHIDFS